MPKKPQKKVHLDHLIPRESLRWINSSPSQSPGAPSNFPSPISLIRYSDLDDTQGRFNLFPLLRKPDFQRETSAWSPEDCVALLASVVDRLIVPSLIVWKNPENSFLYLLDGAHRISVLRAWIIDDWGDKAAEDYYERHEYADEIRDAALATRKLVREQIGSFDDFKRAGEVYLAVAARGASPKEELDQYEFKRGLFYAAMMSSDLGFQVQEVPGDYERAEASFLVINRSGQPLADWETTLIENRNSSLARVVMSIANGGSGRFWPELPADSSLVQLLAQTKASCQQLHQRLFVPPLKNPIRDVNVPFFAATQYFPKHSYLLELLPLIERKSDLGAMFESDRDADAETIVLNGASIVSHTESVFQHLTGDSSDPFSLSLVPLFYFYTKFGRYVRSSLYGFIAWLTDGGDDDVRTRKLIFSAHRGRFEQVIFDQDIFGAITKRIGSGPRATAGTQDFYNRLLELLVRNSAEVTSEAFQAQLKLVLDKLTAPRVSKTSKEGRSFDDTQKTTINLREIYKSAIRCEICGGILDLRMGVQYDHKVRYAESRRTDSEFGRPTHPFCNHSRDQIEAYRSGRLRLDLPPIRQPSITDENSEVQLSLFSLFDRTNFPDEWA